MAVSNPRRREAMGIVMGQGNTPGDIVAERIKQRAKATGASVDAMLKRYVLERILYRLVEAYGTKLMLKGSLVAVIDDPEGARPAPDADVHLKRLEDIQTIIPDLLTRTYYDSESATGLVEDHVAFGRIVSVPLQHSEGHGIKFKIEALLGQTRVNVALDVGFGHGATSAPEIKRIPPTFKGLPSVLVSCQPAADAMADKVGAMLDFGMDSTRVKDLFDIAARLRNGTFDVDAVAKALARSGRANLASPDCITAAYADRHQITWESWVRKAGVKDSRTLADVVEEIRRPVADACRRALRLQERAKGQGLRLVSSR